MKKLFSSKWGAFLLAMACTVAWGFCYPLIKLNQQYFSVDASDIFSQVLLAGVRLFCSGAIITLIAFFTRSFRLPVKRQWAGVIAIMLFQAVIHYALTYLGQGMTDGSKTPILKETSSFFIIIIMHFVSRDDKINAKKALGCLIGFTGVVVMNITSSFSFSFAAGDGIILLAAASNAVGYVFLKLSVKDASPMTVMGLSQLIGGALMAAAGLICGGTLAAVSSLAYLYFALIVICTAIPYLLRSELLKYNKASLISVYSLPTPLFGTLATALVFSNTNIFSLQFLLAFLLIAGGMLFVSVDFKPKKSLRKKEIFSGKWGKCHCQGMAFDSDGKYIYYSFTTCLVKTDTDGNIVGSVENITGHLGCIAFNKADGKVYASLEYKNDAIGKGILKKLGISEENACDAFYIAIFDADKITEIGMNAEKNDVMRAVYLEETVRDYLYSSETEGKRTCHKYGCSGIDGLAIGPDFGDFRGSSLRLSVCYGIYGDTERTDNDYQVILQYDPTGLWDSGKPLNKFDMPKNDVPPLKKLFVYTGNTTYGIQNLEYDAFTGHYFAHVYNGKKPNFPNHSCYVIDGSVAPTLQALKGHNEQGLVLSLKNIDGDDSETPGIDLDGGIGTMGFYSCGDGQFYFAVPDWSDSENLSVTATLYRLDTESSPWKFIKE